MISPLTAPFCTMQIGSLHFTLTDKYNAFKKKVFSDLVTK